jgi:hypothetical protein
LEVELHAVGECFCAVAHYCVESRGGLLGGREE